MGRKSAKNSNRSTYKRKGIGPVAKEIARTTSICGYDADNIMALFWYRCEYLNIWTNGYSFKH